MIQKFLVTRPYSVIDAINRMAAATGSMRYASATSHADYNGHRITVSWNNYRGYWIAEYFWAGRVVLARGTLADCLQAAKSEYERGALGASVTASFAPRADSIGDRLPTESEEDFTRLCAELGFVDADDMSWRTPMHDLVGDAMGWERHGLAPAVGYLANSTSVEEYKAKLDAFFAERKAQRA